MTWTPLADLIAALQISLEKAEQVSPGGFVVADLKLDFPVVLGTAGNQIAVQLPDPGAKVEIPAQYLARISLTLSPGPTTAGALPSVGEPQITGATAGVWAPVFSGTSESLYALWASASGTLYIVGTAGTVLHSGDGVIFGPATALGKERLHAVWGSGSGDVSAAGRKGTLLRLPSPGGAWSVVKTGVSRDLNAIWSDGGNQMYAVGSNGMLLSSVDSGKTWGGDQVGLASSKHGVWGTPEHLFIVGAEGHVECVARKDFKVTPVWKSPRRLHGVWGPSPDVLYAVGEKGLIVRSRDGGKSWSLAPSGTAQHLYAVSGRGADDVYAVGRGGTILRSTDGGDSWSPEASATTEALHAVAATKAGVLYAVGTNGVILRKQA